MKRTGVYERHKNPSKNQKEIANKNKENQEKQKTTQTPKKQRQKQNT